MSCQDAPASSESAELQRDADGMEFRLDECRVGLILAFGCQRSVIRCGSPPFRCRRAIFSIRRPWGYFDFSYTGAACKQSRTGVWSRRPCVQD